MVTVWNFTSVEKVSEPFPLSPSTLYPSERIAAEPLRLWGQIPDAVTSWSELLVCGLHSNKLTGQAQAHTFISWRPGSVFSYQVCLGMHSAVEICMCPVWGFGIEGLWVDGRGRVGGNLWRPSCFLNGAFCSHEEIARVKRWSYSKKQARNSKPARHRRTGGRNVQAFDGQLVERAPPLYLSVTFWPRLPWSQSPKC